MEFQGIASDFPNSNADALAVVLYKDEKAGSAGIKELDALTGGQIAAAIKDGEIKGASGETALFRLKTGAGVKASRLLVVGCGDKKGFKASDISIAAGTATRAVRKLNLASVAFSPRFDGDVVETVQNAVQGSITSQFELDKYKTADKETKQVVKFAVHVEGAKPADLKKGISRGQIIGESMNFTRDLANEPPNILTPTEMANRASKIAKETGLKFEALDEAKMKKLGMGSLLSVSSGSEQPAKLIVLRYTPAKSTAKGELLACRQRHHVRYGRYIACREGMDAMKYDMSGGATVLGTMRAIALLKPSIPVLGIVAAVENMPDGKATRPSDVVTAMNGKTVEILNTDAEGRLVLADAVAYAEKQGATRIIDMATYRSGNSRPQRTQYRHNGQRSGPG